MSLERKMVGETDESLAERREKARVALYQIKEYFAEKHRTLPIHKDLSRIETAIDEEHRYLLVCLEQYRKAQGPAREALHKLRQKGIFELVVRRYFESDGTVVLDKCRTRQTSPTGWAVWQDIEDRETYLFGVEVEAILRAADYEMQPGVYEIDTALGTVRRTHETVLPAPEPIDTPLPSKESPVIPVGGY